jgi:hypothetical protein
MESDPSLYNESLFAARGLSEKMSGRGSQGAWHQDELIGGKPPVVSNFDFDFLLGG